MLETILDIYVWVTAALVFIGIALGYGKEHKVNTDPWSLIKSTLFVVPIWYAMSLVIGPSITLAFAVASTILTFSSINKPHTLIFNSSTILYLFLVYAIALKGVMQ